MAADQRKQNPLDQLLKPPMDQVVIGIRALESRLKPPMDQVLTGIRALESRVKPPLQQLQTRYQTWLSSQPTAVEAAVEAAIGATQGALIGALLWGLVSNPRLGLDPRFIRFNLDPARPGGSLIYARNFAVVLGLQDGITSVAKRVRGKDGVECRIISAFGSVVAYALLSRLDAPNHRAEHAIAQGIAFALFSSLIYRGR